jgi:hypothetical protein
MAHKHIYGLTASPERSSRRWKWERLSKESMVCYFNAGRGVGSMIFVDVLCSIILWRSTMASAVYYAASKHQRCMYFYGTYIFKMRKRNVFPERPRTIFFW